MARINLRSHLYEMGFNGIACFPSGRGLQKAMVKKAFDLIIIDFHLGDNLNGVEVVQELAKHDLLKYKTAVIFVTADRLPVVIGQIFDVQSDDLVIKPYTIKILARTVNHVLKIHTHCGVIFELMDKAEWQKALKEIDQIFDSNVLPKSRSALLKLRARILIKLHKFTEAVELYRSVLDSADNVIWAKWGLVHAYFLNGETEKSETLLQDMLGKQLTNDKACEWLARISVSKKEYVQAESYIDMIKESALSMAASKLKAYLLQAQDKIDEAIQLLERKRTSNQHIREKYAELSLELARCYLFLAEGKPANERAKPIQVARFLIGSAGRKYLEENLMVKRDYMNVLAAALEGDVVRANELLDSEDIRDLQTADISTMTDAIKAYTEIGNEKQAAQIMYDCEQKMAKIDDMTDYTISELLVSKREEDLGERRPRALKYNKEGLELHSKKQYHDAVEYFYQAYILFPKESAFGLNLLQDLVEAKLALHRNVKTLRVFTELEKRGLTGNNLKRLNEIGRKISLDKDAFLVSEIIDENSLWNAS